MTDPKLTRLTLLDERGKPRLMMAHPAKPPRTWRTWARLAAEAVIIAILAWLFIVPAFTGGER